MGEMKKKSGVEFSYVSCNIRMNELNYMFLT